MKKFYSLILIGLCFCSEAQSWCPPGATWHYREYSSLGAFEGIHEYRYTKDTVINAINCKQIVETRTTATIINNYAGTPMVNPFATKYYTYESNQVVYLYNGSSFDTVVNFNASVGDKWLRLRRGASMSSARNAVEVTNVGQMNANGTILKKITTTYTFTGSFGTGTTSDDLVEKLCNVIGGKYASSMLFPFYDNLGMVSDYPQIFFLCYRDNDFALYNHNPQLGCVSTLGIDESAIENSGYTIGPNPTNDFMTIKNDKLLEKTEVLISDICGKEVIRQSIVENTRVDLRSLDKGIYFLQVLENGKRMAAKKIVKE